MLTRYLAQAANFAQLIAFVILGIASLGLLALTGLSASGVLPWLDITATFGATALPWAGPAVQIGFTVLLLILTSFMPASYRVLRLEHSHRRFEIDMDDVTRAYRAAHYADRAETFEVRREFDAIRERFKYLKAEPGIADIDDNLLTIGAQMSEQSRELAETFSDRRVARVRENLVQRQEDANSLEQQLERIKSETAELELMRNDIGITDEELAARIGSLQGDLIELNMPQAANDDPNDVYLKSMRN
ncbi:DNA repair protein [Rhodobacteraceae bacterium]|nr:DNA repair protein [Paracoccaceae bacterium]